MDTSINAGPVQVNGRPEEAQPSDPASFIQDLANKVCVDQSLSQYISILAD
jgi:hypothetical protein